MQKKKTIHFQLVSGGSSCNSDLPFDRGRLKKTKKKEKVTCYKCLDHLDKKNNEQ